MVLGLRVGGGGHLDALGTGEVLLPGEVAAGAVDEPGEDTGALLGDEDVGQVVDLAFLGDDPFEGDQAHAAPEGEAAGADLGAVVAEQPELVGGLEGEEVLAHPAGLDLVAAGEQLDPGLVEAVAGLELGADDDAPAVEFGEVGGVAVEGLGHEEAGRGRVGVVAEELDHDVEEDGLAVLALAVEEGHDLGADVAADRVAEQQVQEVAGLAAFLVVAEGVGEEAVPARGAHPGGGEGGGAGVVVDLRVGRDDRTGAQVDDAAGGAQGVGVGVEEGGVEDHAGGGLGLGQHGVHAGGGQGSAAVPAQVGIGVDAAGVVVGDALGHLAGGPQDGVVLVELPAVGGPAVPADAGDVPVVASVEVDEELGVAAVGEGVGKQAVRTGLRARIMARLGLGGGPRGGRGGGALRGGSRAGCTRSRSAVEGLYGRLGGLRGMGRMGRMGGMGSLGHLGSLRGRLGVEEALLDGAPVPGRLGGAWDRWVLQDLLGCGHGVEDRPLAGAVGHPRAFPMCRGCRAPAARPERMTAELCRSWVGRAVRAASRRSCSAALWVRCPAETRPPTV